MKASMAFKIGLLVASLSTAGFSLSQAPAGGPGFAGHRPPMEQAMGGMHGDHGRWWNNPKIVEKLKLTDDQRRAMDGILQQHREKLIDLRANLEKAELVMEPLMRDDQPNENAILAQIDKIAQARADLEKANARFLLALRGKLTPDQWKQVQAFRESRGEGRRGWGEGGDRGPRPDGRDRGPGREGRPMPPPPSGQAPGPQGMLDDDVAPPAPPALPPAGGVQ